MVITRGNPFQIHTNTTEGKASSLLPSHDRFVLINPRLLRMLFMIPYMGFMIQVNNNATTASGKNQGSIKITRNMVLPLNSLFSRLARINPRMKCPATTSRTD